MTEIERSAHITADYLAEVLESHHGSPLPEELEGMVDSVRGMDAAGLLEVMSAIDAEDMDTIAELVKSAGDGS